MDEVLTVDEVAQLLKVTSTTVRRWCSMGWLPAFKIGRAWRIPGDGLERLMEPAGPGQLGREFPLLSASPRQAEDRLRSHDSLWSRMCGYYEQFKRKEELQGTRS